MKLPSAFLVVPGLLVALTMAGSAFAAGRPEVGKKTVVQAVIAKDGKLVSAVVSMSASKKGWDTAALAAVRTAAPFDPFPGSYGASTLEVHFHVSVVP